jgi:hypothetical protein
MLGSWWLPDRGHGRGSPGLVSGRSARQARPALRWRRMMGWARKGPRSGRRQPARCCQARPGRVQQRSAQGSLRSPRPARSRCCPTRAGRRAAARTRAVAHPAGGQAWPSHTPRRTRSRTAMGHDPTSRSQGGSFAGGRRRRVTGIVTGFRSRAGRRRSGHGQGDACVEPKRRRRAEGHPRRSPGRTGVVHSGCGGCGRGDGRGRGQRSLIAHGGFGRAGARGRDAAQGAQHATDPRAAPHRSTLVPRRPIA